MRQRWSRREAMLAAILPVAALLLLNYFYMARLHAVHPGWYWAADAVQFVLLPAAVACWLLRPAGLGWRALGLSLRRERWERDAPGPLAWIAGASLIVALAWPAYRMTQGWSHEYGDPTALVAAMPSGWWARAALAVYLSVTAAFVEEIVFRALPWLYLRELLHTRWRIPVYLFASSVLFAFCHTEQGIPGVWTAGWFGLVAAIVYLRMRTLWPAVIGHFALDLLLFGPW